MGPVRTEIQINGNTKNSEAGVLVLTTFDMKYLPQKTDVENKLNRIKHTLYLEQFIQS